ncbi:ferritin family protein [Geomonas subterranea]|uniref:Ferritin family protein n=1 Tax=Geomonas subterranea TaxID=2847989 RepID=A0ABX8LLQ4_9BACT|nr:MULTISPECIES: ferritin family protein [Geomonas]QXE90480.1 ferritin family protein [Geomonas subterranea]QXM11444.1 ferritin family protein [Geomonas subterranea]
MAEQGDVCYTFEAAIEMAAQMENEGFRAYLAALRIVKDKAARQIIKEAAFDELEHKHQLEKALVEGEMKGGEGLHQPVPTMNLDYVLPKRELRPDSTARDAMAYAIHLEKGSIDFYDRMSRGCEGAPMAVLFKKMLADESRHLQELEDLYEQHFMTEN